MAASLATCNALFSATSASKATCAVRASSLSPGSMVCRGSTSTGTTLMMATSDVVFLGVRRWRVLLGVEVILLGEQRTATLLAPLEGLIVADSLPASYHDAGASAGSLSRCYLLAR